MTDPATTADPTGHRRAARRRYALVGVSNRGVACFARPLLGPAAGPAGRGAPDATAAALGYGPEADDFSAYGDLVATLDADPVRAQAFADTILPPGHPHLPSYGPDGFAAMVAQTGPDAVIVASPDYTHAGYILAGLASGIDVITEKPMTATAADAARVLAAERSSGRTLRVTHNFRYPLRHQLIKQLLVDGAVGRILHIGLEYHVDIRHGASYFLRWNRRRDRSGGLSIHKSSHHLDLIAWWLADLPATVYALGGRDFYGPAGAHRPRGSDGAPLCGDAVHDTDPYYRAQAGSGTFPTDSTRVRHGLFDLPYPLQYPADAPLDLYDTEIDVEDNFAALIGFRGGARASYSVDFSSPWEGYRLSVTGTDGTLEAFVGRTPTGDILPGGDHVTVRPLFGEPREIPVPTASGGHDGADPAMRRDLFVGVSERSRQLDLVATSTEAAYAVAAGEAVWRSIAGGAVVEVDPLLELA